MLSPFVRRDGLLAFCYINDGGHDHVRGLCRDRDGHRDRSSLHGNRARTLCAYPNHDDYRYHDATSDFCAIHNYCASNPGRASGRRPSSYHNYRDRQFAILLMAAG